MQSTFPASWYREPAFFQLERRAIFSKSWILISHSLQFDEPGKYVTYEIAGYPFFVIKDRTGQINAFLNVCRHRAFPILHEKSGKALALSCKYHGWSYGMKGNLAKAPRFDHVEGFDKSEFSLWKLHTYIDARGFLWVNLDASEKPTLSWEEQFGGVDLQDRLGDFDMDNYVYDHTWSMEGAFNWKTLIENYNECYHCPTAHPGLAPFFRNNKKMVYGLKKHYVEHLGAEGEQRSGSVSPTQKLFYMMSMVPISATKSLMRYEVYRHKSVSPEDFKKEVDFFGQVEAEDKWLANGVQGNFNGDTYVTGPLHPDVEEAVSYVMKLVRNMIHVHADEEKQRKAEWWPARRSTKEAGAIEDEAFCRDVCKSAVVEGESSVDVLAW
ncbi:hypothetical protein Hte_002768 [Hypoxylon texense]